MPKSRDILKMMNSGAVKRMGENHDKETKRYEKENDLCNDSSRSYDSRSDWMRRKESRDRNSTDRSNADSVTSP